MASKLLFFAPLKLQEEVLEGSNQYRAEGYGLQDAKKGQRITRLPPILSLQLKACTPLAAAVILVNPFVVDKSDTLTNLDLLPPPK